MVSSPGRRPLESLGFAPERAELNRRDQVTATSAWPSSRRTEGSQGRLSGSSTYWERERPTCTERQSLNKTVRMEGWRQRRSARTQQTLIEREKKNRQKNKNRLDTHRPSHGRPRPRL